MATTSKGSTINFFRADPSYGAGVANGLGIDLATLPKLSGAAVHV